MSIQIRKNGPYPVAGHQKTAARTPSPANRACDSKHLLQALIAEQQGTGYLSHEFKSSLAAATGLAFGEVEAVAGFYHFLENDSPAAWRLYLSTNITDYMQGQESNIKTLQAFARENPELLSVGLTSCTGMCDQGPAALVNGFPITGLSADKANTILDLVQRGVPLSQWPDGIFNVKDNIRKAGPLLQHHPQAGSVLGKVMSKPAAAFLPELAAACLKGRGGAGFPTHVKWETCAQLPGDEKYVVCNADEGEPGTFKDRVLLTSYLDNLLEGMSICAYTTQASRGFIYLRYEYLYLTSAIQEAIDSRREAGLLGKNILGSNFSFDLEIHLGAGAYVCGEESALIESLEGKRGIPRIRPPFPVERGYLGKPTVVNNVETFCLATLVADQGAEKFRESGTPLSPGSKLHSISGDLSRPGIYEFPMGISVEEVLEEAGAADCKAVQVAGPAGVLLTEGEFNRKLGFEDIHTGGSLMVFNEHRQLPEIVANYATFFRRESCGFCTPCRVGCVIVDEICERMTEGHSLHADAEQARSAAQAMQATSHCGLGVAAGQLFGRFFMTDEAMSGEPISGKRKDSNS